jgi:excisionase family DNA binding protein
MTASAKLALHSLPLESHPVVPGVRAHTPALLSVEEVATLLKVPPSWVYDRTRLRTRERIPGFRLGKYWRFREADVLAWLDRQRGA